MSHPAPSSRRPLSAEDAALIAEVCSRSDLIWLRHPGTERFRAAWQVWHDDAVCVVSGAAAGEQQLPDLERDIEVLARSKETGTRLVSFLAEPETLAPGTPSWDAAAKVLGAARLNAQDPARQRERWASDGVLALLRPIEMQSAGAGDDVASSGALPPPRGNGTTLGRQPFHLGSRLRRARKLRGRAGGRP